MSKSKWLVLAAAFGMMAATGDFLVKVHRHMRLGDPGVKVGAGQLFDEGHQLVAQQCVLLPDTVAGLKGSNMPVTTAEVAQLPKDTTFGRKLYADEKFNVANSVVLMGTDRTSIHQPQYCLDAQGWHIDKTEQVSFLMENPHPYLVPALKLTATRKARTKTGGVIEVRGIYVYWFVCSDKVTSDQGSRMWSLAKSMVEKGVLERWAYISYLSVCYPGQEQSTCRRLESFIRQSVPEFQIVAEEAGGPASVAER
ncbi:MAG TPA: exosortase-associated EpsI family protein [Verrucomicrobiae bacterium]|jgi:hypothetical protein